MDGRHTVDCEGRQAATYSAKWHGHRRLRDVSQRPATADDIDKGVPAKDRDEAARHYVVVTQACIACGWQCEQVFAA